MILWCLIYFCGKFHIDTITRTVFGKEFVKRVWGKIKTISGLLNSHEDQGRTQFFPPFFSHAIFPTSSIPAVGIDGKQWSQIIAWMSNPNSFSIVMKVALSLMQLIDRHCSTRQKTYSKSVKRGVQKGNQDDLCFSTWHLLQPLGLFGLLKKGWVCACADCSHIAYKQAAIIQVWVNEARVGKPVKWALQDLCHLLFCWLH